MHTLRQNPLKPDLSCASMKRIGQWQISSTFGVSSCQQVRQAVVLKPGTRVNASGVPRYNHCRQTLQYCQRMDGDRCMYYGRGRNKVNEIKISWADDQRLGRMETFTILVIYKNWIYFGNTYRDSIKNTPILLIQWTCPTSHVSPTLVSGERV